MKFSDIAEINRRVQEGEWVRDIPLLPGVALKVRGINSGAYSDLRQKLVRQLSREDKAGGTISEGQAERIDKQLLSEALLLDWTGIEGDDGAVVPYSKETAEHLVSAPEYQIFRDGVQYAAMTVASIPAQPAS